MTKSEEIYHRFVNYEWNEIGEGMKVSIIKAIDEALKEGQKLPIHSVSGSLQDIQEIIEFLQWVFRKIDKGDTPEETVRMLLMNRAKIDNIKFDSNDS